MDNLDSTLFPGVSSNVLVHDGFRNEHALTAPQILTEVKSLIASKGATSVTLVRVYVSCSRCSRLSQVEFYRSVTPWEGHSPNWTAFS